MRETVKSEKKVWDVVVIGAGIGGICAAVHLARAGYKVIVVEPKPPAVFRVGESLDWEAPVYLKKLGLSIDRWVAEGKATYKGGAVTTNTSQPGVEAEIGFSPLFRFLLTMVGRGKPTIHANREMIDEDLFAKMNEAGAELIIAKASKIETDGDLRVTGVILDNGERLEGKFYIDAAGRTGLFRRTFGIGQDMIGPKKVVVRSRFSNRYDGKGTRIRTDDTLGQAAWIWDINISDEITDIGLVIEAEDFANLRRRFKTMREIFLSQTQKHEDLDWLSPLVTEDTKFWTCTFQDMVSHKSYGGNWLAVGEAAFVVDAILSSGFTMSLRTGFNASKIIKKALQKNQSALSSKKCRIYHEKTFFHVRTIDRLIDVLWYKNSGLREFYSIMLNVNSILFFNFNLNHFHTRYTPHTLAELYFVKTLHRFIDAVVPPVQSFLIRRAKKKKKFNPYLVTVPKVGNK